MVAMSFTACSDDWGKQDPPAGGQIYPSKQIVATYDFEYSEEKPEFSDFDITNKVCEVVMDDSLGSNVLRLDSAGAARIANPFNGVKLQSGAGIAFYVKVDTLDLERPLFSFGAEDESAGRFYFTANGQLSYSKPGQLQSLNLNENDPAVYKTGILDAEKWHFVALQLTTTGYQLYVDGNKSLSGSAASDRETSFSYQTLVDFIQSAPYIYIGTNKVGEEHTGLCIDDLALVRNEMEEKDWNKKPGSAGSGDGDFEYVVGDPITEIGASDNSSGFWTDWSNYYRIPANGTVHLRFTNHSSTANNWNNWVAAITTDDERGGGNYLEYVVLRADLYGWGDKYAAGTWSNEGYGDWDAFRVDMDGAVVDMIVKRSGTHVTMTAISTATNGNVYKEVFEFDCNDANEVLRTFLTVDGCHLTMDQANCDAQTSIAVEKTEVGTSDNAAGFWSDWSDYFSIPAGATLHLGFKNNTSTANNWNNWVLAVTTDDERGGGNYVEYLILRADLFGWGTSYAAGAWTSEGYGDWDAFRVDMNGANVQITVARSGETVTATGVSTAANGTVYSETFTAPCGDGKEVLRSFLTVDGCYLVMDPNNCYLSQPLYK